MSLDSQIAFAPLGKTVAITAAATAPDGVQVPTSTRQPPQNAGQYRVVNAGENTVFLGVGVSAASAKANAVAATSGTPAAGIPVLAGGTEILRFSQDAYISAYASSDTTVYITPGQGL